MSRTESHGKNVFIEESSFSCIVAARAPKSEASGYVATGCSRSTLSELGMSRSRSPSETIVPALKYPFRSSIRTGLKDDLIVVSIRYAIRGEGGYLSSE